VSVEPLPLYLLAGGQSARFGSDKARAMLTGEPLILHAARPLRAHASEVTAVADREDKFNDLALRTIADLQPGLGPLGGLQAALRDREARLGPGWVMLGGCDLLGLQPGWIERLIVQARPGGSVVAFRHARWEPLPALYHTRILTRLDEAAATHDLALWRLVERSRAVAVLPPAGWAAVVQVNTAADLARHAASLPPPREG